MPRRSQRTAAMLWHADWLDAAAGETEEENHVAEGLREGATDEADLLRVSADPDPYVALRRRMQRQITGVVACMQRVGEGPLIDRFTVRAALVARLAHIQTVRLWGPDSPQTLRREATLLRDLASQ
jgi:hypothetical protein